MPTYDEANHCLYLRAGGFDPNEPNNLDRILAGYGQSGAKTLLVHFHGGLVSKAEGQAGAKALFESCYGTECYPVFFIWESGFLDALWRSLPQIFAETIFRQLLERVSGYALGKIDQMGRLAVGGGRGERPPLQPVSKFYVKGELAKAEKGAEAFADKSPATVPPGERLRPEEENEVLKQFLGDADLQTEAAKIAQGLRTPAEVEAQRDTASRGEPVRGSTHTLMSPEVIDEMRPAPGTEEGVRGFITAAAALKRIVIGAVRVLAKVIERFAEGRDHGTQATIVEELLREFYLANVGKAVWSTMKADTARAFGSDAAAFGGTAFLQRLRALCAGSATPPRVVLVGHSTGAVYICQFLKHADAVLPAGVRFDTLLLAPACDFKLLADTLHQYERRIGHFRLFAMQDATERKDLLLDVPQLNALPALKKLYPGSLLYFVSGVLENGADWPIVGMQRFGLGTAPFQNGAFPEIDDVRAYLANVAHGSVWSIADAGDGLSSAAVHHSDFHTDPTTLKSLAHILRAGF